MQFDKIRKDNYIKNVSKFYDVELLERTSHDIKPLTVSKKMQIKRLCNNHYYFEIPEFCAIDKIEITPVHIYKYIKVLTVRHNGLDIEYLHGEFIGILNKIYDVKDNYFPSDVVSKLPPGTVEFVIEGISDKFDTIDADIVIYFKACIVPKIFVGKVLYKFSDSYLIRKTPKLSLISHTGIIKTLIFSHEPIKILLDGYMFDPNDLGEYGKFYGKYYLTFKETLCFDTINICITLSNPDYQEDSKALSNDWRAIIYGIKSEIYNFKLIDKKFILSF